MKTFTVTGSEKAWFVMVDGKKRRKKYESEAKAVAAVRAERKPGDHFTKICSQCGDWHYHRHSAFGYRADF